MSINRGTLLNLGYEVFTVQVLPQGSATSLWKPRGYPPSRTIGYCEEVTVVGSSTAEVLDLLVAEAAKVQTRALKAYEASGLSLTSELYVNMAYPSLQGQKDYGNGSLTTVNSIVSTVAFSRSLDMYYYQTQQHRQNPEKVPHPQYEQNIYRRSHLPFDMEVEEILSPEASAVKWMETIR